eukprot:4338851-Pleurochrysis_carterae.AAC.1
MSASERARAHERAREEGGGSESQTGPSPRVALIETEATEQAQQNPREKDPTLLFSYPLHGSSRFRTVWDPFRT